MLVSLGSKGRLTLEEVLELYLRVLQSISENFATRGGKENIYHVLKIQLFCRLYT